MPLPVFESRYRPVEMNLFSVVIATLFGVFSVIFLVLLVVAIVGNLRTGIGFRKGVARQLSALRLDRMLGILGIDRNAYLHGQPIMDIRRQMKRCSGCANTLQCDQVLDGGAGDRTDFCPNEATLKKVRETLGEAS